MAGGEGTPHYDAQALEEKWQARQAPVLGAGRDQRVDALATRPHALHQLARECHHLGVSTGLEVLPEQREAPRVGLVSPEQVDLIERLEGQLA